MKQYIIKKLVYADNIYEIEKMFPGGETVSIELNEEIKTHEEFGFKKQNREGDKMVSKI